MAENDEVLRWMDALIDYARDWDATFPKKEYFTQEFWYLLVACYRAERRGTPLTLSEAMGEMKTGSPNVRRDRIQNAIDDGYLLPNPDPTDGRSTLLIPTPDLKRCLTEHFARTRLVAIKALTAR